MDRRLVFTAILILAVIVAFYKSESKDFCQTDLDCVPEQCCHPYSCVDIKYKPDCSGIMCTQVCEGPIDCGAGSCKCVNNRCHVVPAK